MKKTLAALAVLGAFAGSSMAADVTLYGIVDEGLLYTHQDADNGSDSTDKFSLESGLQSGSRWGLKGTEDLGNGYSVGFILESGFSADTGAMKGTDNTLFDREASLSVYGPFGQLSVGRIGSINQGTSSWGKLGMISAFGTSFVDYVAQAGAVFAKSQVWNNMIAYQTPSFAGFKVYAQYGMGDNNNENKPTSDRYYVLGATYNNGPAAFLLSVDSVNYDSEAVTEARDGMDPVDDSLSVTFGGSWDFQVAKVFFGTQYFDEQKLSAVGTLAKNNPAADLKDVAYTKNDDGSTKTKAFTQKVKGYALELSASAPILGGTGMFGVSYLDGQQADSVEKANEFDVTRWAVSAGYTYALSKRTNLYSVVSYMKDSYDIKRIGDVTGDDKVEPSTVAAMIGMRHTF